MKLGNTYTRQSRSYTVDEFSNLMVKIMRFQQFTREVTNEVYWRNTVPKTNFTIEVRSGLDVDGNALPAPNIGIRILLLDVRTGAAVKPAVRVRRTLWALRNVRKQVNLLWNFALETGKIRR